MGRLKTSWEKLARKTIRRYNPRLSHNVVRGAAFGQGSGLPCTCLPRYFTKVYGNRNSHDVVYFCNVWHSIVPRVPASFQCWRNVSCDCRMVRKERIATVPNVVGGQSGLALKRKETSPWTKIRTARLEKRIHVFLWTCRTSSKAFRSFKATYVRVRRRKRLPNCWPKYRNTYKHTYIHTYPQMKRGRADRRLVREGLATLAPISILTSSDRVWRGSLKLVQWAEVYAEAKQ